MADKKLPKAPAKESHPDEPFRSISTPAHTEPNSFTIDDEPLDLADIEGLLDEAMPTDFPASDTGLGAAPLPPPLPAVEDATESRTSIGEDPFDPSQPQSIHEAFTTEGPRGLDKDGPTQHGQAMDSSNWDLPPIGEPVGDSGATGPEHLTSEPDLQAEAAARIEHEMAQAAEAARAADEARAAEAARATARASAQPAGAEVRAPQAPRSANTNKIKLEEHVEPTAAELAAATEFRRVSQQLARARDWKQLAEVTINALQQSWSQPPEARSTLLADLGRLQRDRLGDQAAAERTFQQLVLIEPANVDGFAFLVDVYESRGAWRPLYDLHVAAVEATWDPKERLSWTRRAVQIAEERLLSSELSIEAWERLAKLGDAVDETSHALGEAYRAAGRWDRLTDFLERSTASTAGAERRLQLREVAEASLSGLRDAERAARLLNKLLVERPQDPIALLMLARVEARRKNWDPLFSLGTRPVLEHPNGTPDAITTNDLRRIAADALAAGGELDRAAEIYDLILRERPGEQEAIEAKERYLAQSGRVAELVDFLAERAQQSPEDKRGKLLERAALIAEKDLESPARAIGLWQIRAQLPHGRMEALRALEALHEAQGDDEGLRADLEDQLRLVQSTAQRIELLRRLGRHAAHRMKDDVAAERCWAEILRAVPDDRAVRDELVALHRRRGDYAALDRTFEAQAWRPADDGEMRALWRAAAENVELNLSDTARAGAAWRRVLDLEPGDAGALVAIVRHERHFAGVAGATGDGRPLIAALEGQLRQLGSQGRVDLGMEVGAQWEKIGDRAAASAAYERVLWWAPGELSAIEHLLQLRGEHDRSTSAALLDRAAGELSVGSPERLALIRQQIELVPETDPLGRFYAWRRLYRMAVPNDTVVKQMTAFAIEAGAFRELEAVLIDLAAGATDPLERRSHNAVLAGLYESKLQDPLRALLAHTLSRHDTVASLVELEPMLKLCEVTQRFEDAYALLGVATRHDAPADVRVEAIRRRIVMAETRLHDPERAFHECTRLLVADPGDEKTLQNAKRLAGACKLGRALDALYTELGDRADTPKAWAAITRERYQLRAGELADPAGALDQLWLLYQLVPSKETEGLLLDAAEQHNSWDRALAVIEARVRAGVTGASLLNLAQVAELHEQKRNDAERALELSAAALVEGQADDASAMEDAIARLAEATGRWNWLVESFRVAASRSGDPGRALRHYRKVAAIYGESLKMPELALDMHRRILQLDGNDLASLEVSIEHLGKAELWRELRDALQHWVQVSLTSGSDRKNVVDRKLQLAAISRDRLGDPELALSTFAEVLEIDPANQAAMTGIESLTGGAMTPELEVRRLHLELQRVVPERRVELVLRIAKLHEDQLQDRKSAIFVLRDLLKETGAAGPGFLPLRELYQRSEAWLALIELLEAHAQVVTGPAREQALDEALTLAEAHATEAGAERAERLCRALAQARPDDMEARRRLLSLLRATGRFEELADRIEESLGRLGEPDDDDDEHRELRSLGETELAHLLERQLGKPADAAALLRAQIERRPERRDAILELAGVKLRQNDVAAYISLRTEHAKTLPASLAAYVLCHLAEVTDEKIGDQAKVLDLYRAARAVDPANPAALDALKAVGRRAKSWRTGAALLPEPGEREMSWTERSAKLAARGEALRTTDATQSRMWFERAIATHADNHQAWTSLAQIAKTLHEPDEERAAARAALYAFMRGTGSDPAQQAEHAQLVLSYAELLRAHGETSLAAHLAWHAYEVQPTLPAAALRVGAELLSEQRTSEAYAIYDRLLGAPQTLSPKERLEATFRRGALRARFGDHEAAIADFREGLRIEELYPPLLGELAQVLAASGRVANAAVHHIQALLLSSEKARRANLYAQLGRLFEGALGDPEEAGVCFDRAIAAGSVDPQVMRRALGHYRMSGQIDRALSVIEQLVPSTQRPEDLAALWAERGRLLTERDPDKAVEAFDMALSYDSSCGPAVNGLAAVLESRGDWAQLLELLEVRAEQGPPEERAEALRGLARIASGHMNDAARAERYLRDAIELAPKREDYELLLKTHGDDPSRRAERRDLIAALVGLGGPLLPRIIEIGRELVAEGHRHWAWSLLAPLMNTTLSEPALKTLVLDLRKEFEKAETVGRLTPTTHEQVRSSDVPAALFAILEDIGAMGAVGPTTLDGMTLGKLDARTAVGKTFLALGERLGHANAALFRAQELTVPFVVLDGDTPQVVLRADLVQLMAPGETNFLFTMALEHARSGARGVLSLPASEQPWFLAALLDVLGIAPAPAEAADLKSRIAAVIPANRRADLAARLNPDDRGRLTARDAGARLASGLIETARRVALVAAADLRFAAKVLTRLDDTLPKMPTAGRMDDLDDFLTNAAPIRQLVAFAASSQFARAFGG